MGSLALLIKIDGPQKTNDKVLIIFIDQLVHWTDNKSKLIIIPDPFGKKVSKLPDTTPIACNRYHFLDSCNNPSLSIFLSITHLQTPSTKEVSCTIKSLEYH